jgi:hypothetical protein
LEFILHADLPFQVGVFDQPSLIRTMAGYRGYGLSKYEKVLDEAGDWLKAYQDDDFLFVQPSRCIELLPASC